MLPSFFMINEWLYIERALYEHFHTPDCTFSTEFRRHQTLFFRYV